MQIAVNGKQLKVGDSLRGHIENSISQISEKYFGNPIEAAVTMSRDGTRIRADIASIRVLAIRLRDLEVAALSGEWVVTGPARRVRPYRPARRGSFRR